MTDVYERLRAAQQRRDALHAQLQKVSNKTRSLQEIKRRSSRDATTDEWFAIVRGDLP